MFAISVMIPQDCRLFSLDLGRHGEAIGRAPTQVGADVGMAWRPNRHAIPWNV
jgi:hypothetical protein